MHGYKLHREINPPKGGVLTEPPAVPNGCDVTPNPDKGRGNVRERVCFQVVGVRFVPDKVRVVVSQVNVVVTFDNNSYSHSV